MGGSGVTVQRQALAFAVLKALLIRKVVTPEIYDIMKQVHKQFLFLLFIYFYFISKQELHFHLSSLKFVYSCFPIYRPLIGW